MPELSDLSICFLAGTLGQGGAERQLFHILRALTRQGTRLKLLSLTRNEYWEQPIRKLGVPIVWVGQSGNQAVRLARIVAESRRGQHDLIQSQHFYTNLYATLAARLTGKREIGALRSDVNSEVGAQAMTGKACLKLPRTLAANSRAAIENALRHGVPRERLRLLPNVVDARAFKPGRTGRDGTIRLLAAGRLSPEKRLDRFLALLARIRRDSPLRVSGVIAGDGPLLATLRQQAAEQGLAPGHLEFRGEVTDMASTYGEADILVLTSEFEGTPNVILEAMACGLPVVATTVGGVPEIVEHGRTGLLIDRYDESEMSAMILRLAIDPHLRNSFGLAARQAIEENHALERLPQFLTDLYRAALV